MRSDRWYSSLVLLALIAAVSPQSQQSQKYAPPAAASAAAGVAGARAGSGSGDTVGDGSISPLTWVYTSPEKWYSQHDLCIIKNWHAGTNLSLVEVATSRCKLDPLSDEWTGRLYVGYGDSYKATCSPPLTDRPQYMQALVGFNDPSSQHLLEAMRNLLLLNRTLVFMGDNVMRQNYVAFLAELKRLDKHMEIDRWASLKKMANKTVLPRGVNVFVNSDNDLEGGGATLWLTHTAGRHKPMAVYYIACHRLEQGQFDRAMQLVGRVAVQVKGVILVSNFGLAYNDRSAAFKAMGVVLPALSAFANKPGKKNAVLWRETSAQHFEFRAKGYFDHVLALSSPGKTEKRCAPHNMIRPVDRSDEVDWRNEDVKTILGINQITNLHYVPFFAATVPLHAMHPDRDKAAAARQPLIGYAGMPVGQGGELPSALGKLQTPEYSAFGPSVPIDCTLMCHLPTLWQPVWRAVADVVKNELNAVLGGLGAKEVDGPSSSSSGAAGLKRSPSLQQTKNPAHVHVRSADKEKDKPLQYVRLAGSNTTVPVGPNFVLSVVSPSGAVVRNGIDIDKSAVVMNLPQLSNISSIRSVPIVDDDGFQIIRYEVRNRQGGVEGWISSHMRDGSHAPVVKILQYCIMCVERLGGG